MKEYFVSYFAQTKFGSNKVCSCIIKTEKPITNGESIEAVRECIRAESKYKAVVIISFKELGEEK